MLAGPASPASKVNYASLDCALKVILKSGTHIMCTGGGMQGSRLGLDGETETKSRPVFGRTFFVLA